jgi:hypothetical protein
MAFDRSPRRRAPAVAFGPVKIFMHGRSQAVRLPQAFRLPGDRARVRRVDGGILLRRRAVHGRRPSAAADAAGQGSVHLRYFLDTSAVIALLKNEPVGVRRRFRRALSRGAPIAISSVVLYELWYGVARSERRRENTERLHIFCRTISGSRLSTRKTLRLPVNCAPLWNRRERRSGLGAAGRELGTPG